MSYVLSIVFLYVNHDLPTIKYLCHETSCCKVSNYLLDKGGNTEYPTLGALSKLDANAMVWLVKMFMINLS